MNIEKYQLNYGININIKKGKLMKKNTILLTFMIDALRYDYIKLYKPPFLELISHKGYSKIISEPLTYQTRPTYFAGLYPDQSDIANLFQFEPEDSPFKFLKIFPLRFINRLCKMSKILNYGIRFLIKIIARNFEKIKGNTASYYYLETYSVPLQFLPFFAYGEKKNIYEKDSYPFKTIFNYLRENNIQSLWIGYPTHDLTVKGIVKAFRNFREKDNISFAHIHFSEIDWLGHKYGPESDKIKKKIKEIDRTIKFFYDYYQKKHKEIKLIIFGDHGMVPVTKTVDIINYLEKHNVKFSKKDLFFIDSNMFRFWSDSNAIKEKIKKILSKTTFGQLLTIDLCKNFHYFFNHNKYGDIIFLTNPGTIFYPNFFQSYNIPKGMHGYGPLSELNDTQVIIFEKDIKEKYILSKNKYDLTALYKVFLQMLELSPNNLSERNNLSLLSQKKKNNT